MGKAALVTVDGKAKTFETEGSSVDVLGMVKGVSRLAPEAK